MRIIVVISHCLKTIPVNLAWIRKRFFSGFRPTWLGWSEGSGRLLIYTLTMNDLWKISANFKGYRSHRKRYRPTSNDIGHFLSNILYKLVISLELPGQFHYSARLWGNVIIHGNVVLLDTYQSSRANMDILPVFPKVYGPKIHIVYQW